MPEDKKKSPMREAFDGFWVDTTFSIATLVVAGLAFIVYGWGAAKLNWSVNQSWFWATIAFLFSGFYYPYYAFFQMPVSVFGAARKLRR